MSELASRSVLVKLNIRQWDGFKLDPAVADDVRTRYNAKDANPGNFNKRLFDKQVLKPIKDAAAALRRIHENFTLPWEYDGVSLLPSKVYFEYTEAIRAGTTRFDKAVENFLNNYENFKQRRRSQLGGLYQELDYPPVATLVARFGVKIRFYPVPDTDHFIVDLENEALDDMKQELQGTLSSVTDAVDDMLRGRMIDVLSKAYDRLYEPNKIFRDTTITNIIDLVRLMPKLNMMQSPLIQQALQMTVNNVLKYEAEELRVNMHARAEVVKAIGDVITLLSPEEDIDDVSDTQKSDAAGGQGEADQAGLEDFYRFDPSSVFGDS